jgi:hypothetical protein
MDYRKDHHVCPIRSQMAGRDGKVDIRCNGRNSIRDTAAILCDGPTPRVHKGMVPGRHMAQYTGSAHMMGRSNKDDNKDDNMDDTAYTAAHKGSDGSKERGPWRHRRMGNEQNRRTVWRRNTDRRSARSSDAP